MTETKDNKESNENFDSRFENLASYVLGALDHAEERIAVENLIERDPEVQAEFEELAEAAYLLAITVPPLEPPASLKNRIMDMAGQSVPTRLVEITHSDEKENGRTGAPWWRRTFQSGIAVSAAAAVLVVVVGSALGYQNNQLGNEINALRADLATESVAVADLQTELSKTLTDSENRVAAMKSEMKVMEEDFVATTEMVVHQEEMVSQLGIANNALRQALSDQNWLTYASTKEGYQVESWLAGNTQQVTTKEPTASGLIAVRIIGNEAVFQVHGLPQPQPGYAYTLWLMGNGDPRPVAQFDVSGIGSATVAFLLPEPLRFFSTVVVTQERVNGIGTDPTGTMVLSSQTN